MIRFLFYLIIIVFIAVGFYTYKNTERTFEAKFKNIDGLPIGARVTALGVEVGKVIRTKPAKDGIIVTVRITNKNISQPPPGSQLTITSFNPNQGKVLEIIPPHSLPNGNKSWIVQEPITTESWLYASIELLDNLKSFSNTLIKYVTPENFEKVRTAFSKASASLSQTANELRSHEQALVNLRDRVESKTSETNLLILKLAKPISSLNKIINDKDLTTYLKNDLGDFSLSLTSVSEGIRNKDLLTSFGTFKATILDNLNKINTSLIAADEKITDPTLSQNIKSFNEHITNLNKFYEKINKQDVKKITKGFVKKAREITTELEEKTSKY